MPHIFANAEYTYMLYVYCFCGGSATAAVDENRRRFHMQRISNRRVFSKVFNTLHERGSFPVLMFYKIERPACAETEKHS
jgi:hypothetical protein